MKPRCLDLDRISTLPPPIIEDILCRLFPFQEAVRTCILSREWRYKWRKITKVEFNMFTFRVSMDENQPSILTKIKFLHAIYQVMLLHQGPIHEFTLIMDADNSCFEIDQVIMYLSRNNTVKNLRLLFGHTTEYRLPLSFFTLHQLTDLYIQRCRLDHQPTFSGFANLTSLIMRCVDISAKSLLHLLSCCPLLNSLNLHIQGKNIIGDERSTITELFQALSRIEYLSTWHWITQCFAQDGVPKVLPTTLVHLKYFSLEDLCFYKNKLSIVSLVIRSSPNLEKLSVSVLHHPENPDSITLEDYSDIWLERLNEFEIGDFINLKLEMDFVKLILAKSPVLKKARIFLDDDVTKDEEMLILRNLLRCPSVSPIVEIIVEHYPYD